MTFHIITLFPRAFDSYLNESILKRAIEHKKISVRFYNPRDFAENKWKRVDHRPYGGGPGMVIEALPIVKTIEKVCANIVKSTKIKNRKTGRRSPSRRAVGWRGTKKVKMLWLSPTGTQFTNTVARHLARRYHHLIIICGRYEGIDARVKKVFTVKEVSAGPYVLTGGELPAMMIVDAVSRQIRQVLGDDTSREETRTASPDVYTRPARFTYRGKTYRVPPALLSGDHAAIENWKAACRARRTRREGSTRLPYRGA